MRARVVSLLAMLVSGMLLAGCGGHANGSTESFSAGYAAASQQYRTDLTSLQDRARTAVQNGPTAEVDVFRQLVTVTQAALGRFDALHPSSDASSDFNDLRDSLRQQLRSLRSAVSALRSDDSAGLNTALSTYADEVQQGLSLQHRLDSSIQARGP